MEGNNKMILKIITFLFGKLSPEQKKFCLELLKGAMKEGIKGKIGSSIKKEF